MFAGTQFGRYEIRGKIGEGGMGEVYSAHDLELDRDVAIKLLPNEFVADDDRRGRFKQEARVVSALNHPNIITIYEIGENEHGSFLATEFVEGKTLREIMKSDSMTLTRILRIIEQAANALVAAHAAGIVHRDIKPENIMVRRDAIVKVLDFGLAKPIIDLGTADGTTSSKTIPGTVMGSSRYMSPEQARGHEVDQRTDIWSLGVVLYEMLTGTAPFDGDTTADTIAAVVYKEPMPLVHVLPNAPFELQRIVRKALQKDREERYQSIKDLALDIKDLLYALDHANSGERTAHIMSDPSFSENPTMIHRTVSGNHPTGVNTALHSQPYHTERATASRTGGIAILGVAAAIALIAVVGFGFYNWYGSEAPLAATAFSRPQISRINTDGRVLLPAISPDGKSIAYVSGELGSRSLVVRQIATDSIITLVPPTSLNMQSVSFSPSGDHVYYTQMSADFTISTLYQVPAFGGTPKKVIDDVDGSITFSPDGKEFAFVRHVPKTNEDLIMIVDAETLTPTQLLSSAETEYSFFVFRLAWSPDGRTLITGAGKRQSGFIESTDIVAISIDDKTVRPINRDSFFTAANFAWFADGSGLVFTGRREQNEPSQIWRAEYPSGAMYQVTNDPNEYVDLGLTADGRTVVTTKGDAMGSIWKYSPGDRSSIQLTSDSRKIEGKAGIAHLPGPGLLYSRYEGKEGSIWLADADGKNGKAIFQEEGYALDPVFSPDGKYVVFNLQRDKQSRIWRINADGTGLIPLSEEGADHGDNVPQVTPDGNYVIFQRRTANQERVRLMRVPIDGGQAEVFYEAEDRGIFHPRISPDGKRIAFTSFDIATTAKMLHVAAIENGRISRIERDIPFNLINNYQWSPDGKELTILTNRGGTQNIWRQPIEGGEAKPITDFSSGRIFNFAWAANGRDLLIARGTVNNDLIMIRDSEPLTATTQPSRVPSGRRSAGPVVSAPRFLNF
jgi:serine/threonine protein kinase